MRKAFWALLMICILITASATSVILAEEDDEKYDDEVVVTATRTPQNQADAPAKTEVVTKEEIKNTGSNTVSEVLENTGQMMNTTGGTSGEAALSIDGTKAAQTLIMINGIPVHSGGTGYVDLSYIPTTGVNKIEVVHGPLSSLYGANALGGVVNIISDLTGNPQEEFGIKFATYNTDQIDLLVQQEKWGLALGGLLTDGYRDYSKANNTYFLGQYDFYSEDDEYATFHMRYLNKTAQVPSQGGYPRGDKDNHGLAIDVSGLENLMSGKWEYKVYYQSLEEKYQSTSTSHYNSSDLGLDLAGDYQVQNHGLLGGFLLKKQNYKSTNTGDHTIDNVGVFIQDDWRISSAFSVVSGIRWDKNSSFESPVCPRIILVHQLTDDFTVKAGYGKAYNSPTIDDLYYSDAWGWHGNPDLKPEEGERYDVIGEWRKDKQRLSIDLFMTNLINGISWGSGPSPINEDKSRITGYTLSWQNRWQSVSAQVSYQGLDKEMWDNASQSFSIPKNDMGKSRWNVNMGYDMDSLHFALVWQLVSGRTAMPDYTLTTLNFLYKYNQKTEFTFAVNNLFNQQYEVRSGYPMPGTEYQLGMRYTF